MMVEDPSAISEMISPRVGCCVIIFATATSDFAPTAISLSVSMAQRGLALITGGCGGLGLAFAKRWLARGGGARVRLVDLAPAAAGAAAVEALGGAERAEFVRCDVTKTAELEAAFADADGLALVLNNAGVVDYSGDLFADWRRQVDVNVGAVVDGTRLAAAIFEAAAAAEGGGGGGAADRVVVNVGSMAGLIATPQMPVYTCTKFGVVGFSRAMHVAARRRGFRVHALCPSFTDTGMINENVMEAAPQTQRGVAAFGGLMTADRVADELFTRIVDDAAAKCVLRITPLEGAAFDEPGLHPAEAAIRNDYIRKDPVGFVKRLFGHKPPRTKA